MSSAGGRLLGWCGGLEEVVDFAGDVALRAADGFAARLGGCIDLEPPVGTRGFEIRPQETKTKIVLERLAGERYAFSRRT
jgi:hypothetical protein